MTINRRKFIKAGAVSAATFTIVPRHVLGGAGFTAPSDRVNVALIGAGGRGFKNAKELMKVDGVTITDIVDPAEHWNLEDFYYKGVAGRLPVADAVDKHYSSEKQVHKCRLHSDYRKFFDGGNDVDAVLCATPDHAHALVSLRAMREGKHVYCEKPLTHNIAEARLVAKVAKETGVATQLGNQLHSSEQLRTIVEMIRAGAIGNVTEVHAWVPATRWNPELGGRPTEAMPIPKGLDWDLWQGPRKAASFHSAIAPVGWRDFWTYGLGAMGDFGCHDLDAAVWALELGKPTSVEMHPAGYMDNDIVPFGELGYFDFAARGDKPPVKITWYSGGPKPKKPEAMKDDEFPGRGVMFVGEKGTLVNAAYGSGPELLEPELKNFQLPAATLPKTNGHHQDWIDAARGGPAASSNFEVGAHLTEITLLGVVALRLGKKIQWDDDNMKVTNSEKAEPIINGEYRAGWKLS
ncbi:Gfo/Idh/MocA family protein [Mariniblastus fucicola]|uniref:Glucose--fructose oxidoreductase n=1 Tax=Mariniblastus fucicola TaxID=980251 RepID=A0A5B9PCC4_9BACT|nr:Gfo/Idh/MocA family oxidoreductase [Mariniblastus fucicola]QEG20803.1 Glucose--fructose oxidoreductase precursor [Mariniblastus fucicola]